MLYSNRAGKIAISKGLVVQICPLRHTNVSPFTPVQWHSHQFRFNRLTVDTSATLAKCHSDIAWTSFEHQCQQRGWNREELWQWLDDYALMSQRWPTDVIVTMCQWCADTLPTICWCQDDTPWLRVCGSFQGFIGNKCAGIVFLGQAWHNLVVLALVYNWHGVGRTGLGYDGCHSVLSHPQLLPGAEDSFRTLELSPSPRLTYTKRALFAHRKPYKHWFTGAPLDL